MNDIIKGEYYCPRCGCLLDEKRPLKDKHIVINKNFTVRLSCKCGYYEDRVIHLKDFKDFP